MTSERQFRVFTKGITADGPEVRRSADWAGARRGWLQVYQDRLELGDWVIPYAGIQEATLFRLRTLLGGYVLYVKTQGQGYQFGLNPWALLGKQLPFPHKQEATRVGHTPMTIAVRVILLLYLLSWIARKIAW